MFKRYGSGLLLLCAAALLGAIALRGYTSRALPAAAVRRPAEASTHYIITDHARLNINLATYEELLELPGIGQVLAEQIIAYRTQHGAFSRPEDVLNVAGVGAGIYEGICPHICTH